MKRPRDVETFSEQLMSIIRAKNKREAHEQGKQEKGRKITTVAKDELEASTRSKRIGKKPEEITHQRSSLTPRCSAFQVHELMSIISHNFKQKTAVVKLGFDRFFHLPMITIRQELMNFLISAFNCNLLTLSILNKREIEIDAADTHVLFGIPFGQITMQTYDMFLMSNYDRAPLFAS